MLYCHAMLAMQLTSTTGCPGATWTWEEAAVEAVCWLTPPPPSEDTTWVKELVSTTVDFWKLVVELEVTWLSSLVCFFTTGISSSTIGSVGPGGIDWVMGYT